MLVTDPIADMLTRIRNALIVKHDTVDVPVSVMKLAIADILLNEGYIKGYTVGGEGVQKMMTITLKYGANRQKVITGLKQGVIRIALKYTETGAPVISGIRRVSKPGLRIYTNCEDMPKVMKGLGTAIISTSKGVMTDKAARANNVGGEVLAYVW